MIIGITTTYVEEEQKDEIVPVERVTVEYVRRVAAAGAVPVLLPPVEGGADANRRAARELVERLDGLVLAGGGDLNPATYGDEARLAETVNVFDGRDALELELARLAHERDLPTLGICRGMQVLNVALGGALYQDVHACGLTDAAHQQKPPYDVVRQRVDIAPGSVLDRVLCDGAGEGMVPGCKAGWPASLETSWEGLAPAPHSLLVNTMHHQAIACVADPLQVSAVSGDGLVEGLEDPSRRFYLGVQWHPEYLDNNVPLFEALVAAAKHAHVGAPPIHAWHASPALCEGRLGFAHGMAGACYNPFSLIIKALKARLESAAKDGAAWAARSSDAESPSRSWKWPTTS